MKALEIILISIGLGMDAFAVSVCKGLSMKKMSLKKAIIIGAYFGVFQFVMPIIGYKLGTGIIGNIESIDHWIAFVLLGVIGLNMIKETRNADQEDKNDDISFKTMLILAIATSIDALVIGITFSLLNVNIMYAVSIIGIITFLLSLIGVKIGNVFGDKYEKRAQFMGGIILILMGLKILLEHLNIIKI